MSPLTTASDSVPVIPWRAAGEDGTRGSDVVGPWVQAEAGRHVLVRAVIGVSRADSHAGHRGQFVVERDVPMRK